MEWPSIQYIRAWCMGCPSDAEEQVLDALERMQLLRHHAALEDPEQLFVGWKSFGSIWEGD